MEFVVIHRIRDSLPRLVSPVQELPRRLSLPFIGDLAGNNQPCQRANGVRGLGRGIDDGTAEVPLHALRHVFSGSESSGFGLLELACRVRTGRPVLNVNDEPQGVEFFHDFVEALFPVNYPATQALAGVLGLDGAQQPVRVLDLAAGSGVWGIGLANRSPHVTVTAVDWPGVLDVTRNTAERHDLTARFTFVAGDLLTADFGRGHHVATLGHILHSEGEKRGHALLKKTFDALAPGGTIAIAEFLVDDARSTAAGGLLFAVNMLVATTEGDTFSFNEIAGWLREAGFENPRTLDAPGPSPLTLANKPS